MFPALLADVSLEAGKMSTLDVVLFLVAVVGVIAFGIWQGRKESADAAEKGGAAGYFLAGRGLTWWLVGFSLIAAATRAKVTATSGAMFTDGSLRS